MAFFLGVDPGSPLTIALIDSDENIVKIWEYEDVALEVNGTTKGGNAKVSWSNHPALIAEILRTCPPGTRGVVEFVVIRPNEALGPAQKFVGSMWLTLGAAAGIGMTMKQVVPAKWKRDMGIKVTLKNPKEPARLSALEAWPGNAGLFKLKKHHNRAEACLLALWLKRSEEGRFNVAS